MRYKPTTMLIVAAMLIFFFVPAVLANPSAEDEYSLKIHLPFLAKNYFHNWVWHEVQTVTLTPSPNPFNLPLLTIDQQGRPHLFWDTLTTGQRYIYHTYLTESGWSAFERVANTLGQSETLYPPVVGPDGRLHLLWHNDLGTGVALQYRLMYASFDGANWSPEEEVIRVGYDLEGKVRLDDQGKVHVTSVDTLFNIYRTFSTHTATGWLSVNIPSPDHYVSWILPDMHGGVHLYGSSYFPTDSVFYSYWQDGQYKVLKKQFDGEMGVRDSLLDFFNNLHLFEREQVAIPGDTVWGVTHQCLDSAQNWGAKTSPSGEVGIDGQAQGAVDRSGLFALGWKEDVSHKFSFGIWQGCAKLATPTNVPLAFVDEQELTAVAVSTQPQMFCMLVKKWLYHDYTVICADF